MHTPPQLNNIQHTEAKEGKTLLFVLILKQIPNKFRLALRNFKNLIIMLKNISNLGETLNKNEQQAIKGGIWNSLAECQEHCPGSCLIGFYGKRWACGM